VGNGWRNEIRWVMNRVKNLVGVFFLNELENEKELNPNPFLKEGV